MLHNDGYMNGVVS